MSSMQDVWNEVDRRIEAAFAARGGGNSGDDSSDAPSSPSPSAGGLPIHNNLHHEPDLAIASDLTAHIGTIASAGTLGHIRIGSGLSIDGSGIVSVSSAPATSFLALTDVTAPTGYIGQANKAVIVKGDESGLEFHTLTASDVGALTQAVADTLYDPINAASDAIAAHLLAADPHPQYLTTAEGDALFLTPAEGNALYSPLGHVQTVVAGGTGLTSIAIDNILYSSASNTLTATPISAFGRSLINDANAAAARTTLELNAGGTGDIWVEKAGDTMSGNLVVNANIGVNVASPVNPLHIKKDQDLATDLIFENQDAGTAAQVRFQLRNGASASDALTVAVLGSGFTTLGNFVPDGAYISAEVGLAGGLTIMTRAAASIRLNTGGFATTNQRLLLDSSGNVVVGNAALATNATNGFFYVAACAGTPTGVPTAFTGRVPMVYDTINNKFYIYDGGWLSATFA